MTSTNANTSNPRGGDTIKNVFSLFGNIAVNQGNLKGDFKGLKAQAEGLKVQFDKMKTGTDKVSSTFQKQGAPAAKRFADALKQPLLQSQKLEKQLMKTGSQLNAMVAIPLAAVVAGIFASGKGFEEATATIRVGTGATGIALDELLASFRAVNGQVPEAGKVVSGALADLNTLTGQTGTGLEALTKASIDLARITKEDLSTGIKSNARLFGDWGVASEKQVTTLDYLFKTSQTFGIGVTDLSNRLVQFGAPLRQAGFDLESAAVMFGKFEREGVNTELVIGSLRIALGKFAREGVKDVPAELEKVITGIKNAGTAGEANALALETFGARAGSDMAATIREGRLELDDWLGVVKNSPETIAQAADAAKTFDQKLAQLTKSARSITAPLGVDLINALSGLIPMFEKNINMMRDLVDWFVAAPKAVKGTIGVMAGLALALPPIIMFLGSMAASITALIPVVVTLAGVLSPLLGPAGLIIAGGVAVGLLAKHLGLFKNVAREAKVANEELATAQKMASDAAEVLKGKISKDQLLGKLDTLSNNLKGKAKESFMVWAAQAVASGKSASQIIDETFRKLLQGIIDAKRVALAASQEILKDAIKTNEKTQSLGRGARISTAVTGGDNLANEQQKLANANAQLSQMKGNNIAPETIARAEGIRDEIQAKVELIQAEIGAVNVAAKAQEKAQGLIALETNRAAKLAEAIASGADIEVVNRLTAQLTAVREQRDTAFASLSEDLQNQVGMPEELAALSGNILEQSQGLARLQNLLTSGDSDSIISAIAKTEGVTGVLQTVTEAAGDAGGAVSDLANDLDNLSGGSGSSTGSGDPVEVVSQGFLDLQAAVGDTQGKLTALKGTLAGAFESGTGIDNVFAELIEAEKALNDLESQYASLDLDGLSSERKAAQSEALKTAQDNLNAQREMVENYVDYEYEQGNIGAKSYIENLELRRAGFDQYSNEWQGIQSKIDAVVLKESDARATANDANQQAMQEGLSQAKANADNMKAINENYQDYLYTSENGSAESYIKILQGRRDAFEAHSDEWQGIQSQIDGVRADQKTKIQEQTDFEAAKFDYLASKNVYTTDQYIAELKRRQDAFVTHSADWVNVQGQIDRVEAEALAKAVEASDARALKFDYMHEHNQMTTEAYLASLKTRQDAFAIHTSDWIDLQNQIDAVKDDQLAKDAEILASEQSKYDYLYSKGEVTTAAYVTELAVRRDAFTQYSADWVRIQNQIDAIGKKSADEEQARADETAKQNAEKLAQAQATLKAKADEFISIVQNTQNYAFDTKAMSADKFIGILKARQKAHTRMSDEWLTIQRQIDTIEADVETNRQARADANTKRLEAEALKAQAILKAKADAFIKTVQNAQQYAFDTGQIDADDFITILETRQKAYTHMSDEWLTLQRQIDALEADIDAKRQERADANLARLEAQAAKAAEAFKAQLALGISMVQNAQQYAFDTGDIGTDEFIGILKARQKAHTRMSDEWLTLQRQVDSLEADIDAKRDARADANLKRIEAQAQATQKTLKANADAFVSIVQNAQQYAFDTGDIGTDEFIGILKARQKAHTTMSDQWLTIQRQIDSLEADIDKNRQERSDANLKRLQEQAQVAADNFKAQLAFGLSIAQNAQQYAFDTGDIGTDEFIGILKARQKAHTTMSDQWLTIQRQIDSLEADIDSNRQTRADANLKRLEKEAQKASENFKTQLALALSIAQNAQQYAFDTGDIGADEFIDILKARQKAHTTMSDEWIGIQTQIDSLEADIESNRQTRAEAQQKRQEEALKQAQETLRAGAEAFVSIVQNQQDYTFDNSDKDADDVAKYIETLEQRQSAFKYMSDDWLTIQKQMDGVTADRQSKEKQAADVIVKAGERMAAMQTNLNDTIIGGVTPAEEIKRKYADLKEEALKLATDIGLTEAEVAGLNAQLANAEAVEQAKADWKEFADNRLRPAGDLIKELSGLLGELNTNLSEGLGGAAGVAVAGLSAIGDGVLGIASNYEQMGDEAFSAGNLMGSIGKAASSSSDMTIKAVGGMVTSLGKLATGDWVGAAIGAITTVIGFFTDMFNAGRKRAEAARKYQEALYKLELEQGKISLTSHRSMLNQKLAATKQGTQDEIDLRREIFQVNQQIAAEEKAADEARLALAIAQGELTLSTQLLLIDKKLAAVRQGSAEEYNLLRERYELEQSMIADQLSTADSILEQFAASEGNNYGNFVTSLADRVTVLYAQLGQAASNGNTALIETIDAQLTTIQNQLIAYGQSFDAASGFLVNSFETGLYNGIVGMDLAGSQKALAVQFDEYITKQIISIAIQVSGVTDILADQMANISEKIKKALKSGDWKGVSSEIASIKKNIMKQYGDMLSELAPILPKTVGNLQPLRKLSFPDLYKAEPVKIETPRAVSTSRNNNQGTQISEITGSSRAALEDMLRPLTNLNTIPTWLERIHNQLSGAGLNGSLNLSGAGAYIPSAAPSKRGFEMPLGSQGQAIRMSFGDVTLVTDARTAQELAEDVAAHTLKEEIGLNG